MGGVIATTSRSMVGGMMMQIFFMASFAVCKAYGIWFVLLVVVLDHQSPADLRSDWISGKKVLCDDRYKLSKILNHLVIQVCFS